MNPFEYQRAEGTDQAIAAIAHSDGAKFIGGGTNLLDLMKLGIEQPKKLIDIGRLPLNKIEELPDGGLRLGALARNTDTADHPAVRQKYPLLSQAILAGASQQLRNMATNGGNLLQRTRCYYFTDTAFTECNKRAPGSGCGAVGGFNRIHAILGASANCIATHPSDMCIALAALQATVRVAGPLGERRIPMMDFHRLPGKTPQFDTTLNPDELILSIDLPPSRYANHSYYLKIRDRASYAFALVSAAAALDLDGDRIRSGRIALGGVAHKPWRSEEAEKLLAGQRADKETYARAAERLLAGAKPYEHNAFKVELAKRTIVRALQQASSQASAPTHEVEGGAQV
jgi:xanthine dehydrogenase YagS FAD-binding subunit